MKRSAALLAVAMLGPLVASCSSSSSSAGSHSTLTIANFSPFTGNDAFFGTGEYAGCVPAANQINAAGGVLGHNIKCTIVDSRGDPADAVPAVEKMLATTSGLLGVIGPSSDEADATAPILNTSKVVFFAHTGEPSFDKNNFAYYWRISAADDTAGYSLALAAKGMGFTRGAAIFTNDAGAQSNVPTLLKSFPKLGGTIVINQSVAADQPSYQTEVEKMISAHPDVIFTESDPQTASTFLNEYKQLSNNQVPPIVGTQVIMVPDWYKAVVGVLGADFMNKHVFGAASYSPPTGPSWQAFHDGILAAGNYTSNPSQWFTNPFAMSFYDSAVIMALAADEAHSVNPSVWNNAVLKITAAAPGKVQVHTYSEGTAALASGKQIQYVGAAGPIQFDQWHNNAGDFEVQDFTSSNGDVGHVTTIPLSTITQLEAQSQ